MSAPQSLLARYRQLAPNASVRVSPLCLGSMTFGQAGSAIQGETTLEESTAILDAFYKAGGNFIDTANGYVKFPAKWHRIVFMTCLLLLFCTKFHGFTNVVLCVQVPKRRV